MSPLGDQALMIGHRGDIPDVLDATDVLIHPAYADAFPTVLLEAMSSSVPVVATAVGGIPEIVGDGEAGGPLRRTAPRGRARDRGASIAR